MSRVVVPVLAGLALGAAVAWYLGGWWHLAAGATVALGVALALGLGGFALVVARR